MEIDLTVEEGGGGGGDRADSSRPIDLTGEATANGWLRASMPQADAKPQQTVRVRGMFDMVYLRSQPLVYKYFSS